MGSVLPLALCIICLGQSDLSAAGSHGSHSELCEYVITGFISHRENLRSGAFRAQGKVDQSAKAIYPVHGDVKVFSTFDYERELFRFDRTEPVWVRPEEGTSERIAQSEPRINGKVMLMLENRVVRTADEVMRWNETSSGLTRVDRNDGQPERLSKPFDIRVVGFANWGTLDHDVPWKTIADYARRPVAEIDMESEGVYRVVWIDKDIRTRYVVWFDTAQGFAPIKYEQSILRSESPDKWSSPVESGTAAWTLIDGVWLPQSYSQEKRDVATNVLASRTLHFEWLSVNQAVDDDLFTVDGLAPEEASLVVNRTLGVPVAIRRPRVQDNREASANAIPAVPATQYRLWLIVANLLIILVFVAVFLVKRARRGTIDKAPH